MRIRNRCVVVCVSHDLLLLHGKHSVLDFLALWHNHTYHRVYSHQTVDDYFIIMKTLYKNLDRKSQSRKTESSGLASLRKMVAYIEEHYMERITLADIAMSGAYCKSKCSLLFKNYPRNPQALLILQHQAYSSPSLITEKNFAIKGI